MGLSRKAVLFLFSILSTSSFARLETCSIKAETACSGPLFPEDKSYTYSLGSQLDTEVVLKNQVRIYKELRERLLKEAYFPIFVDVKVASSYHEFLKTKIKEFCKKPEASIYQFLKHADLGVLFMTVNLLPVVLKNTILDEIPISRFEIANEAYSEKVLSQLKRSFPKEIKDEDALSEDQKSYLVKYGALSVLASQGLAKRVRLKESAG